LRNKRYGLGLSLTAATTLAALGVGSQAHAQVITQNVTLGQTTTDFGPGLGTPSQAITFNKFNTALGTLNEVDVTWSVSGAVSGTVKNTGASAADFSVTTNTNVKLSEDSGATILLVSTPTLSASQSYTALGAGATANFGPFSPSAVSGPNVYTDSATKAFFSIPGPTGSVWASTLSGTTIIGGGGNITSALTTTAGGTVTIVYRYTLPSVGTPEPGSVALLVSAGIGGMGVFLRRRRSK